MLSAKNITVTFRRRDGSAFKALDDVTLEVGDHEVVGLVGESGSGKTTFVRVLCGLQRPDSGTVALDGRDLTGLTVRDRLAISGGRSSLQMIFQDAVGALNPRKRVHDTLAEVLRVHEICPPAEMGKEVGRLLDLVGIPQALAGRFPHELSGGQCQRVCIARALALNPGLLIGDEPVSALDVSVQARILRLLGDLREKSGLSMLLITHDLAVVSAVCDRVYVLEKGRLVEQGVPAEVFANPRHPYTRRLLSAIPRV